MITKDQVAESAGLESQATALERKAKTFRDRQKQLEKKFEEDLRESKRPSVIRHGYTFAWVDGSATVAWSDEFLKECGVEKTNQLKAEAAKQAKASRMKILPPTVATPDEVIPIEAAPAE